MGAFIASNLCCFRIKQTAETDPDICIQMKLLDKVTRFSD